MNADGTRIRTKGQMAKGQMAKREGEMKMLKMREKGF